MYLITLTAGQKGVSEHAKIPEGEALAAVRAKELACAAEKLGLAGHKLFEFQDQGFAVGWAGEPMNNAASKVREEINSLRPNVVITWGPDGGTGHPDHRAASNIVTQAFQQRSLLTHRPEKLYYVVFPEKGSGVPHEWTKGRQVSDEFVTTEIKCSNDLKGAKGAVECHKSQWTPEQMTKMLSGEETRQGTVSLRLALSTVGFSPARENSIFERLR